MTAVSFVGALLSLLAFAPLQIDCHRIPPSAKDDYFIIPYEAVASIEGSEGRVKGNVTFKQLDNEVEVRVHITGLSPGEHGFHVHQMGDLTNGCTSTGNHFNPEWMNHGAPEDDIRHIGDLGNVEADLTGTVDTTFKDCVISLNGPRSIIGRGLVIHDGIDDLGKTRHPNSKKTGNAGGRAGCGVIGIKSTVIASKSVDTEIMLH